LAFGRAPPGGRHLAEVRDVVVTRLVVVVALRDVQDPLQVVQVRHATLVREPRPTGPEADRADARPVSDTEQVVELSQAGREGVVVPSTTGMIRADQLLPPVVGHRVAERTRKRLVLRRVDPAPLEWQVG